MGIFNWFSTSTEEEDKTSEELVRYLCTFEQEYSGMEEFLDVFFDLLNEAIDRYNKANPVQADKLDKDEAYKIGNNLAFDTNVERRETGEDEEETAEGFYKRKSTFKVIVRAQPHYAIELSGSYGLITPFSEELEEVLEEAGFSPEFATIAKPNLGKAK